jgi:hypothetical protein
MEPLSKTHHLLTKLSHFNWILQFYGNFIICKYLCLTLSKNSRQLWKDNEQALSRILKDFRKIMKAHGEVDNKVIEFLLENHRYRYYALDIEVCTNNIVRNLFKLLQEAEDPKALNFIL